MSRLELHEELCTILGNRNVYYDPPETVKMSYPGIVYNLSGLDTRAANNNTYNSIRQYTLTLIETNPDSNKFDEIIRHFMMCRLDRVYKSDNLIHYVYTLYY